MHEAIRVRMPELGRMGFGIEKLVMQDEALWLLRRDDGHSGAAISARPASLTAPGHADPDHLRGTAIVELI